MSFNRVMLEVAPKKSFASALDWPGWSRPGKTAEMSLIVLADYAPRYQLVADIAGISGIVESATNIEVIESVEGNGATEFGVPGIVAAAEHEFMTSEECERQLALLQACWTYFESVAMKVSPELQKGPRGGGRDRDKIVRHVIDCEPNYARHIGADTPSKLVLTDEGVQEERRRVLARAREVNAHQIETKWPLRYFLRRAAWHVLDHAWEMEDKDLSGQES
ncbi:MAG: hypothetical protein M9953_05875 [Thermomicrobiales bacterium]|nr:hypothetical protein [Thermomicrobiales bacterium]MCO5227660.1 hypothetical protein [Thermomicrobiales bacterium]